MEGRQRLRWRWVALLAIVLFGSPAGAADLICKKTVDTQKEELRNFFDRMKAEPTDCVVAELTGLISKGDGRRLVELLRTKPYLLYLDLDSPGGSLPDALLIGKEVRRRNLFTFVPKTGRCASACFFVWIAGVYRDANSNLFVHRFYSDDPQVKSLDSTKFSEFYQAHTELISRYLQDMEVGGEARRITEMMLHVPPNDAVLFEKETYPHTYGFVSSRDQWLRHRCGNEFANRRLCLIEAILRERLSR